MSSPGRNDPCPCGSGRKFKKCCLRSQDVERAGARRTQDVRESAIARLLEYASLPQFDPVHEAAWDMFWSDLNRLTDDEVDDIVDNADSNSKFDAWFVLDFELEPGGTLIDRFLAVKRSKLDPRECEYLERLRRARLRLFEVQVLDPSSGVHLVDAETGASLNVHEGAGELVQWDVIAARVTTDDLGVSTLEAGVYVYPAGALTEILRYVKAARGKFLQAAPGREESFPRFQALLFHHLWLDLVVFAAPPELLTVEGDPAEPCRMIFDLHDQTVLNRAIADRADVERYGETVRWIEPTDDGPRALGTLRFEAGHLVLDVLSRSRADRGRGWLEALAGPAVTFREILSESLVSAIRRLAADEPLSPEEERDAPRHLREFATRTHRQWLDTPSPALNARTPRAAARSKHLRPRLIDLLKALENQTERDRRSGLEIAPVDWMWFELGLARPEPSRQRALFK